MSEGTETPFRDPHASTSDEDLSFEWWRGERKLTIYITPSSVEYVLVWGTDILSAMSDGTVEPGPEATALWAWLVEKRVDTPWGG